MTGALSHIRVLDLSRVLAGPWATQVFADMGAEVIKVEKPRVGDETRGWGPPFLDDSERGSHDAAYFLSANRGKKSLTLDIASSDGQEIVRRLAAISDVVIENYKVGTLQKYGLAYDDLATLNPRLVYCSISGFGQSGPYAHLPGYDYVFQGMGGLMSLTGIPEGEPGAGPLKVGVAIADILTGMYATTAILAALEHRNRSGRGQYVDLALLDCVVSITSYQAVNYFLSGKVPGCTGNAHPNIVPYNVYPCADGRIILAIANDSQFASFCRAVGRPELSDDPRYRAVSGRNENREALEGWIREIMTQRTMADWLRLLESANVPCGPINALDRVFADPQVQHRGLQLSLPYGSSLESPAVANPINFSESPLRYEHAAPTLGEHTDHVLRDILNIDGAEIARLKDAGVL